MGYRQNAGSDYLKYWRVIRYYMKSKYSLTQADLDMLLFLYSEKYFNKDKFEEFDRLLSWDEDRFNRLRKEGWIEVFRKYSKSTKQKALYQISRKGRMAITHMYKKLNGEEIPTSQSNNSMFAKKVSYSDKRYKEFIIKMNSDLRQQRPQPPE
jgi:hypothetical protein